MLRNAAAIDYPIDGHAVFSHAFENDARMKCCAFDRSKEFVLRRVQQVPAKRYAAQFRIDEHGTIAIVPAQAQQVRFAQRLYVSSPLLSSATFVFARLRNGFENIAGCRKARFYSRVCRMHTARYDAADTGNEAVRMLHGDDAGRRTDDVDDIAFLAAHADRIPVRIECSDRNRNARFEAESLSAHSR